MSKTTQRLFKKIRSYKSQPKQINESPLQKQNIVQFLQKNHC